MKPTRARIVLASSILAGLGGCASPEAPTSARSSSPPPAPTDPAPTPAINDRAAPETHAAIPGARLDATEYARQAGELVHPALRYSKPGVPAPFANGRPNAYEQTVLVANKPEFNPTIMVDPYLADGWGITIRPPGAGGHFWITNAASGTTTTYVGDVPGVPLHQDELKVVTIPTSRLYSPHPDKLSQPTGQVYTGHSATDFVVSGEAITGPSKFVFVTLDGTIAGWTTGQTSAVTMYDNSVAGAMYTGCAVTDWPSGNRLFVCDFGLETCHVFDHEFKPIRVSGDFRDPQVPDVYCQYNMWYSDGLVYVSYGRMGDDPGEEDTYPGYGYLAAFDPEGRLVKSFEHRLELNAPWGMAIAPDDFGALSGTLLISNFGDGTIVAYDRESGKYIDYLRAADGTPIMIDGLWGVLFGNGVRLGQTNHLYFAAGPNQEEDGIFGKLAPTEP